MNPDEKPSTEAIRKLPQWAQKYIKGLEMERDVSVRALNEHLDGQTKSGIYWDEYICTGENKSGGPSSKRFYVQSRRVTVESCGVLLDVCCHEGNAANDPGIGLQWSDSHGIGNHVAMIPKSFQQVALIGQHNMRTHKASVTQAACSRKGHDFHEVKRCAACGFIH